MKFSIKLLFILILIVACQSKPTKTDFTAGGPDQGFLPPPLWNATMQNLKQDMISVQHFIFDKEQFANPENREFLKKQIHRLAEESKNIKHDPIALTKDPTVRFVATQFADEIQRADENFKTGWFEISRGQLIKVTSYCLECHTRMRDGPSFNPENSTRNYFAQLPVSSRIEFMIAFRQFEPAFKLALENLKQDQSGNTIKIDFDRIARLALVVTVQYMQNQEKALQIVKAIENNKSVPDNLRKTNRLWKKSLAAWEVDEPLRDLHSVRLVNNRYLSEVDDMIIIPGLLNLLTSPLSREELGESLYLTGRAYENLHRFSFLSLHENYYESCVRQSAHTKWGAECYRKLSDSISEGYSASAGTDIPRDVKLRLDNLKKVIEESK